MYSDLIPGQTWTETDENLESTFTRWFTPFPPSFMNLDSFTSHVISLCNQGIKDDDLKIKLRLCAGMHNLTYRPTDKQIVSISSNF